jgi:hypothetical protein
MSRVCFNHSDTFCYVCGERTYKYQKRNFTPLIKKWYELYFGYTVSDQDKIRAPHMCYVTCVRLLTRWVNDLCQVLFAIPMVQRQPNDNSSYCYFCLTHITGITQFNIQICHLQWDLSHTVNGCPYQILWRIWILAMTTLILMIMDSKHGTMLIAVKPFKLFLIWTPFIDKRS